MFGVFADYEVVGPAITNVRHDRLFPSVGLKRAGDHVRVNFGQSQFVFDIDSLVEVGLYHPTLEHSKQHANL
jgi:hypothetical protein